MLVPTIVGPSIATLAILVLGCGSAPTSGTVETGNPPARSRTAITAAEPAAAAGTPGEEPTAMPGDPAPPDPAGDPAPASAVADLEAMCAAVDRDYDDGTLSDYFAGLRTTSAWGARLRARADESTTPGRILEEAARAVGVTDSTPGLTACRRLFEYLDDVE